MKKWLFAAASLLMITPAWANVYYGGFEDRDLATGDKDYNDIVFQLSGADLVLNNGSGSWLSNPTINESGNIFWDNTSADGSKKNVGYEIYGGGTLGSGVDPTAEYLAGAGGSAVNDVSFTASNGNAATVLISISGDSDALGWYYLSDPSTKYALVGQSGSATFSVNAGQAFALYGTDSTTSKTYSSDAAAVNGSFTTDTASHFAFFQPATQNSATPEPGVLGLFGMGLLGAGALLRKRIQKS